MEWQEIEVFSGGRNIVYKHPEMFSGTVVETHTPQRNEGVGMTDGRKDTLQRGPDFRAGVDPETNSPGINPWFEIDLGKPVAIDRVILYASRYSTQHQFLDKGHRVLALLGDDRRVDWAAQWNYYDNAHYPGWHFLVRCVAGEESRDWHGDHAGHGQLVANGLADGRRRSEGPGRCRGATAAIFRTKLACRGGSAFARRFFALLADDVPELADARGLYAAGQYGAALDAWKRYWFAKMKRTNMHVAFHGGFFTYGTQADDLVDGLAVTIGDTSASAIRFTPAPFFGSIFRCRTNGPFMRP